MSDCDRMADYLLTHVGGDGSNPWQAGHNYAMREAARLVREKWDALSPTVERITDANGDETERGADSDATASGPQPQPASEAHHALCFQMRPDGPPSDLPRDLCDCRILRTLGIHESARDYEVWDDSVAPGGMVCRTCGSPVESEPCYEHNPIARAQQGADRADTSTGRVPPAGDARPDTTGGNR